MDVLEQYKWQHASLCNDSIAFSRLGSFVLLFTCVVLEKWLFPWQPRMPNIKPPGISRTPSKWSRNSSSSDVFEDDDDDDLLPVSNFVPESSIPVFVFDHVTSNYITNITQIRIRRAGWSEAR